jgi:hypothetical protein
MAITRDGTTVRWFQFRLTTLLMWVLVSALAVGWWTDRRGLTTESQERANLIAVLRTLRDGNEPRHGDEPRVTVGLSAPGVFSAGLDIPVVTVEFQDADSWLRWVRDSNVRPDSGFVEVVSASSAIQAAVPVLLDLLEDQNSGVTSRAAFALAQVGVLTAHDAPRVTQLLTHRNLAVRLMVVELLGEMGSRASAVTPAVAAAFRDSESQCRSVAGETLFKIAPPVEALASLLQAFEKEQDEEVRRGFAVLANELDRRIMGRAPRTVLLSDELY